MSGNIFVDFVFLFLICYALISIFYNLSDFLMNRYCKYPHKHFFVLLLRHEENLERDLRCAISKSIKEKCALIVVCDELNAEEYKIVWRIADVYEHIVLTTRDELIKKLDAAKNISVSL